MALGAMVILAPIFWLGAVSYSRHQVQAHMARAVAGLDAIEGVGATNRLTHDGFFSAEGTLSLAPGGERSAPRALIDWRVRYGALSTRFSGSADIEDADRDLLLADRFAPGQQAHFSGRVTPPGSSGSLDVVLPARLQEDLGVHRWHLEGARFELMRDKARLEAALSFESFAYHGPARALALDTVEFASRRHAPFRGAPDSHGEATTGREDRLQIAHARLQQQGGLPLSIRDIDAAGTTRHVDGELRYRIEAALEEVLFSEQALGSAELDAVLERLDDRAATALWRALPAMLAERGRQPQDKQDKKASADLAARRSTQATLLWAPLADSPRLRVRTLSLESPMFDENLRLSGTLGLDGEGITETRLETLRTSWGRAAFKRRLNGDLVLHNTPPLLSLVAGQAPDEGTLELAIREGVLLINGEPWVLLN